MLKGALYVGAGLAGGYTLSRILEARAAGVPIGVALQQWDTPIVVLANDQATALVKIDGEAVMPPTASLYR